MHFLHEKYKKETSKVVAFTPTPVQHKHRGFHVTSLKGLLNVLKRESQFTQK